MSYFLDLAKAFDSVPHEQLLLKLKINAMNGFLLKMAQSSKVSVRSLGYTHFSVASYDHRSGCNKASDI